MGACDFVDLSFGGSVREAYSAAIEEALHEYGHNGYNGTISTSGGFMEVKIPEGLTSEQFREIAFMIHDEGREPEKPPIRRKFDSEWDKARHEQAKSLFAAWDKLKPEEKQQCRRAAEFQKWEQCIAYIVPRKEATEYRTNNGLKGKRGNVYCFFGLAAI